jgi:hypothetical protein
VTPDFGTKPTNEAWVYTYTLTLASAAIPAAGIDNILKLATATSTNYMNAANTQLRVWTDSGLGTELLAWTDATSVSRTGDGTLRWVWTVAAGTATGVWGYTRIRNQADDANIWSAVSAAGSKTALVQRDYRYTITL